MPTSECIEWEKYRNRCGYGVRRINGRLQLAHRVAYCAAKSIPIEAIAGRVVLHACDNPACVNPNHLILGTQAENIADMDRKGRRRAPVGVAHPRAKLTEEAVKDIRSSIGPAAQYQLKYGISAQLVSAIRKRQVWKCVSDNLTKADEVGGMVRVEVRHG